ncbi:MAG: hypothetical protein ACXWPM_03790 [Bdellovibrionota bacterium]
MFKKFQLKKWESALVVISILIFFASLLAYVSGFPMRNYIFGLQDDEGSQFQVGKLGEKNGDLRRQLVTEAEFKSIDTSAPLYNLDTIVTGPDSGAKVLLEDGGVIELGPNTMVKLAFDSRLTLGGITRSANVNVLAGTVTGESKTQKITLRSRDQVVPVTREGPKTVRVASNLAPPPQRTLPATAPTPRIAKIVPAVAPSPNISALPSPAPLPSASPSPKIPPKLVVKPTMKLELLNPKNGARLSVAKGSKEPQVPILFGWKFQGVVPNLKMSIAVTKLGRSSRTEVLHHPVDSEGGGGSYSWIARAPGNYEWQLLGERGEPLPLIGAQNARAQFYIEPEFEGIEVLDALVGGQAGSSNLLKGDLIKNFDITLHWKPYGDQKAYHIWFGANAKATKALLEKDLKTSEYSLNKGKLFTGTIYYRVTTKHSTGFIVSSGPQRFMFNFLPPILVVPEDKISYTKKQLRRDDNSILFTWQKTNFTDLYELEIGLDPDFKQSWVKRTVKENYFVLKAPQPGKYFWHVRSFSKDFPSGFSKANGFEIQKPE